MENDMDIDTDDRLRERACIWCGKKLLYFDTRISLIDPIGVRISCRDCGAKGPVGASKGEALELYLYGPSAAIQKQNKKSIINAILIGAE